MEVSAHSIPGLLKGSLLYSVSRYRWLPKLLARLISSRFLPRNHSSAHPRYGAIGLRYSISCVPLTMVFSWLADYGIHLLA